MDAVRCYSPACRSIGRGERVFMVDASGVPDHPAGSAVRLGGVDLGADLRRSVVAHPRQREVLEPGAEFAPQPGDFFLAGADADLDRLVGEVVGMAIDGDAPVREVGWVDHRADVVDDLCNAPNVLAYADIVEEQGETEDVSPNFGLTRRQVRPGFAEEAGDRLDSH